jgi:hypothetical protein
VEWATHLLLVKRWMKESIGKKAIEERRAPCQIPRKMILREQPSPEMILEKEWGRLDMLILVMKMSKSKLEDCQNVEEDINLQKVNVNVKAEEPSLPSEWKANQLMPSEWSIKPGVERADSPLPSGWNIHLPLPPGWSVKPEVQEASEENDFDEWLEKMLEELAKEEAEGNVKEIKAEVEAEEDEPDVPEDKPDEPGDNAEASLVDVTEDAKADDDVDEGFDSGRDIKKAEVLSAAKSMDKLILVVNQDEPGPKNEVDFKVVTRFILYISGCDISQVSEGGQLIADKNLKDCNITVKLKLKNFVMFRPWHQK